MPRDLPPGLATLGIHGEPGDRFIYFTSASGNNNSMRVPGLPNQWDWATRLSKLDAVLRTSRIPAAPEWVHPRFPDRRMRVLRGDLAFLMTGLAGQADRIPPRDDIALVVLQGAAADPGDGPGACVLPLLFRAWRRGGSEVRDVLSEILRNLGVDPKDPAPRLVALLGDPGALRCRHAGDCHPWICRWTSAYTAAGIHPIAKALVEMGPEALPALSAGIESDWPEACLLGALEAFEGFGKASLPYLDEARRHTSGLVHQRLGETRLGILYGSAPKHWFETETGGEETTRMEALQPPP